MMDSTKCMSMRHDNLIIVDGIVRIILSAFG